MPRRNSGLSKTRDYKRWSNMIERCHSLKHKQYASYGGRGILVCDRWRFGENGKTGFDLYVADMGPRPSPKHSVDRRDNDKGYSPDNCRWATGKEQCANRRGNLRAEFQGEMLLPMQISERTGIAEPTVRYRIKAGLPLDFQGKIRQPNRGRGGRNHKAVLTEDQVREIKRILANGGERRADIAKRFGVKLPTINAIASGRNWPNVRVPEMEALQP